MGWVPYHLRLLLARRRAEGWPSVGPLKSLVFETGLTVSCDFQPRNECRGVLVFLNKLHMLSRGLAPSAANDTLSWEAPKQPCLLMAPCWHSTTAPSRRWRSQAPHSRRLAPLAPAARPLWNKERQCVSFFVAHYLEAMSIRTSYH